MAEPAPSPEVQKIAAQLPDAQRAGYESFNAQEGAGYSEKLVDQIEMIGEETSAGFGGSAVSPGMRYLHSSRTIHQLVTDRNRAVGIYLAVASLLLTASGAVFHARPEGSLIIPIEEIQRWCFPVTFAALTVLALFVAFLLVRTRVGLIYEVAKMNALLGLPLGRVQRINPLSIHFILQAFVSCAGGATAALFAIYMVRLRDPDTIYSAVAIGTLLGIGVAVTLMVLDMVTVAYTTSDKRLQDGVSKP